MHWIVSVRVLPGHDLNAIGFNFNADGLAESLAATHKAMAQLGFEPADYTVRSIRSVRA